LRANALPRALLKLVTVGAAALMGIVVSAPALAQDLSVAYITPADMTPELAASRLAPPPVPLRGSFSAAQPQLTNDLLAAYVKRQQEIKSFDVLNAAPAELTQDVLLSYIDRTRGTNLALDAIDTMTGVSGLNADMLETYAQKKFVPTVKKVKLSKEEQLCLTQAIYHEARGESEAGQWAVANVIINRAMSKKFPSSLCGVVFQNADKGRFKCQFTFACDGRSDFGTEQGAWKRASKMAQVAVREFQAGDRPGVVPNSTLYYHTTAVAPSWSNKFHRVAAIGSHLFYATN
jgi:spore germination cell wall hydrolase CwlJ-like protein